MLDLHLSEISEEIIFLCYLSNTRNIVDFLESFYRLEIMIFKRRTCPHDSPLLLFFFFINYFRYCRLFNRLFNLN